jgi:uncharacterized peroxidase-related enzyme
MTTFAVHTAHTAPAAAAPILDATQKGLGFVPNLFGVMADNPAVLEAYTTLGGIFDKAGFSATERQVIKLTASFENACHYCTAAESAVAGMLKVDPEVISALREQRPLADRKLEALRTFTRTVIRERGFVAGPAIEAFRAAGYTNAHVLGVILGVAIKTISNYTNHVAETPLDAPFQALAVKTTRPTVAA